MRKGGSSLSPFAPCADEELTDPELLDRFVHRQDAAAFAQLLHRHGPMVISVCRRVLGQEQEAEDAFQATFIVLVRRAASLQRPELLGNWLYGVAYRTAQKARARLARRRHHERQVEPMSPSEPPDDLGWQEIRGVLDDALRHLPVKYRVPLVLCYLEGMTNEEAARRLGWPVGSMSYRLARGRQLLRERLQQRRQLLSATVLLALLRKQAGPQEVPEELARATLRAALGPSNDDIPLPPFLLQVDMSESAGTAIRAPVTATSVPVPRVRRGFIPLLCIVAAVLTAGVLGLAVATDGFAGWDVPDLFGHSEAPAAAAGMDVLVPVSCH